MYKNLKCTSNPSIRSVLELPRVHYLLFARLVTLASLVRVYTLARLRSRARLRRQTGTRLWTL
jgi:hypothetical protein